MFRLLFAWSLLLLCVSPVTAPFSTCDLLTLLVHQTHDVRATELGASVVVAGPDALSLSPEIRRIALSKPALSRVLFASAPLMARGASTGQTQRVSWDPTQGSSPAHEHLAQPTVLRL